MARKKKAARKEPSVKTPEFSFNQPFEGLASLRNNLRLAEKKAKTTAVPSVKPIPAPPPPPPDDQLFFLEMGDVVPIMGKDKHHAKKTLPPKAWETPKLPDEDLEALKALTDLVSGRAEFDLRYTDEYVEGQTRGLPPTLMDHLRAGRIPYQNHLDLHGYTLLQAEAAVTRFVLDSVSLGRNCVLLIHGRGLGSQDGIPVLKRYLESFLLRGPARKYVLAFTTACPADGGLGASYILLRG